MIWLHLVLISDMCQPHMVWYNFALQIVSLPLSLSHTNKHKHTLINRFLCFAFPHLPWQPPQTISNPSESVDLFLLYIYIYIYIYFSVNYGFHYFEMQLQKLGLWNLGMLLDIVSCSLTCIHTCCYLRLVKLRNEIEVFLAFTQNFEGGSQHIFCRDQWMH